MVKQAIHPHSAILLRAIRYYRQLRRIPNNEDIDVEVAVASGRYGDLSSISRRLRLTAIPLLTTYGMSLDCDEDDEVRALIDFICNKINI